MPALDTARFEILKKVLEEEFVPHLPPLIDQAQSATKKQIKNLSRAFSAFVLSKLCNVTTKVACQAVVDDFDDFGLDAIFYDSQTETIYLVQSKLKEASAFTQDEALAFCQGVRKLINQDLSDFNQHVQNRKIEIEEAVEDCSRIQLIIAHTGDGITNHAKLALEDLFKVESEEEMRLVQSYIDFNSSLIIDKMQAAKALSRVNTELLLWNCSRVADTTQCYIGVVALSDLAKLHNDHKESLYEKNIRNFLGKQTEVNKSISDSLKTNPNKFFFLNNGVTLLCDLIDQKGLDKSKSKKRKFKLRGISVINGAQTISTAASILKENPGNSVSEAKVTVTLIQADSESSFGKDVTRARNHQNPVHFTHFVALDDEQERLRRELSYLNIRYVYKAEASSLFDDNTIHVDEASQALALFQPDPRYPIWLKKDPSRFLDTTSSVYKSLFTHNVTPHQLVNAVRLYRYINRRMIYEAERSSGIERLAYKHGNFALGWILAKQLSNEFKLARVFDTSKIDTNLSVPFDALRQKIYDQAVTNARYCGPLALFRNQAHTIPVTETIMIDHFTLSHDPVLSRKRAQTTSGESYPIALFDYVISKAPQIGNLS